MKNNEKKEDIDMIARVISKKGSVRTVESTMDDLKEKYSENGIQATRQRCWCCIAAAIRWGYLTLQGDNLICNRNA
ncbi:MAG: hypothetical protein LUE31_01235 [Lachnospiraceae bacterium]|nr:hypothetical protein [Lachnospiraceae bacterium]